VLRVDLHAEHSTPLGRDQPRIRERLDVVVRRARREPRPRDPDELAGLGRSEPAELRRGVALCQQGGGDQIGRLSLVRAVGTRETISMFRS
jgi:low affinity Fe/Cu permease